jgi:hypothetical protein
MYKLKLKKLHTGSYATLDNRFVISRNPDSDWWWLVQTSTKDKYERTDSNDYRTRSDCERTIIALLEEEEQDLALWEG